MAICKTCGKEFKRTVTKGRNLATYCSRTCYDNDHFIWSQASDQQKLSRMRQQFEKKVIRRDGCWGWKGSRHNSGYAEFSASKNFKEAFAHRVSWILHTERPIEPGMFVCHSCDNPICTNPSHLFLGTTQDNTADRHQKGRTLCGSQVATSVLTEEFVKEIKSLIHCGCPHIVIERLCKISHDSVKRISEERAWARVPWPNGEKRRAKNPNHKLTKESVLEIKKSLISGETCASLSERYKVTKEAIFAIKCGKNWKHVILEGVNHDR